MKRKNLWGKLLGIAYGFLLIAFTVYVVLDTFVIERVYTVAPSVDPGQSSASGDDPLVFDWAQNAVITANSYEDENISIVITNYTEDKTRIHVADVKLSSPEYLKTAFAQGTYGRNVKAETTETAKNVHAIFAVNGDYYGARYYGYVVRNGILYRNTPIGREVLAIYADGSFGLYTEKEKTAEQLVGEGAVQVICFGPILIKDGEISISTNSKIKQPRTAIGLIDDLHYLFVVTDGRTNDSAGLTYQELAEFMLSLGVKEAYNLDGGGSSAMYFNGVTVNKIADAEREVSDIVYIGY